jgi:hypothetical protein
MNGFPFNFDDARDAQGGCLPNEITNIESVFNNEEY